jgi:hypothetical protein
MTTINGSTILTSIKLNNGIIVTLPCNENDIARFMKHENTEYSIVEQEIKEVFCPSCYESVTYNVSKHTEVFCQACFDKII